MGLSPHSWPAGSAVQKTSEPKHQLFRPWNTLDAARVPVEVIPTTGAISVPANGEAAGKSIARFLGSKRNDGEIEEEHAAAGVITAVNVGFYSY